MIGTLRRGRGYTSLQVMITYIASGDDYRNHRLEWTVPTDGPSVGIDWFAIKVTIV